MWVSGAMSGTYKGSKGWKMWGTNRLKVLRGLRTLFILDGKDLEAYLPRKKSVYADNIVAFCLSPMCIALFCCYTVSFPTVHCVAPCIGFSPLCWHCGGITVYYCVLLYCTVLALWWYCHYSCNDSLPANGGGLIFTQTLLSFSDNEDGFLFLIFIERNQSERCSIHS